MPISLLQLSVGQGCERKSLLVTWGVSSGDDDENKRCFYRTGDTAAIFVTLVNVGHPKSDRTYANWIDNTHLTMEVHERDLSANTFLRRAGKTATVGLFFRKKTGTDFTYLGRVVFSAEAQIDKKMLFFTFDFEECSNALEMVP